MRRAERGLRRCFCSVAPCRHARYRAGQATFRGNALPLCVCGLRGACALLLLRSASPLLRSLAIAFSRAPWQRRLQAFSGVLPDAELVPAARKPGGAGMDAHRVYASSPHQQRLQHAVAISTAMTLRRFAITPVPCAWGKTSLA